MDSRASLRVVTGSRIGAVLWALLKFLYCIGSMPLSGPEMLTAAHIITLRRHNDT